MLSIQGLHDCICKLRAQIAGLPDLDQQTLSPVLNADGVTVGITISNGNTIPIVHPDAEPCEPTIISRGALLGLRNAGTLDVCTTYIIPAYSRGCLQGDILIKADDAGTLSHDVNILTAYDTEAWEGRYDIQSNRVVELHDNLGNEVYGRTGVEVDRFPWGDPNFSEVKVRNADLFTDCDPSIRLTNVSLDDDAQLDVRGAAGYIIYSKFETDSNTTFNGATNVRVQSYTAKEGSQTLGNGGSDWYLLRASLGEGSYIAAANRPDVRLVSSSLNDRAYLQDVGADRMWLYYSHMGSFAINRLYSGRFWMYYTDQRSYSEQRLEAGAGDWYIYYSDFGARAYRRNYNTANVREYAIEVGSRGETNYTGGTALRTYYSSVRGYGRLRVSGTANIVYANDISSQSIFTVTGGNHYRNVIGAYARLTTNFNTRSVTVFGSFAQTLTAANSNTGRGPWGNSLV